MEDDFVMVDSIMRSSDLDEMDSINNNISDEEMKQNLTLSSDEEAEIDECRSSPSTISSVQKLYETVSKEEVKRPISMLEPGMSGLEALETAKRKRSMRLSQHVPDIASLLGVPTLSEALSSSPDRLTVHRPSHGAVMISEGSKYASPEDEGSKRMVSGVPKLLQADSSSFACEDEFALPLFLTL